MPDTEGPTVAREGDRGHPPYPAPDPADTVERTTHGSASKVTFVISFAATAAVFTLAWLPLHVTARRRNRPVVAAVLLTIGLLLAAFLAAGQAGSRQETARCEAAGYIGCGDIEMAAGLGIAVFGFLYLVVVLLTALIVRLRKPKPAAAAGPDGG